MDDGSGRNSQLNKALRINVNWYSVKTGTFIKKRQKVREDQRTRAKCLLMGQDHCTDDYTS